MLHISVAEASISYQPKQNELAAFSGELSATSHVILRNQVLVYVCALLNLRLLAKVNFWIV